MRRVAITQIPVKDNQQMLRRGTPEENNNYEMNTNLRVYQMQTDLHIGIETLKLVLRNKKKELIIPSILPTQRSKNKTNWLREIWKEKTETFLTTALLKLVMILRNVLDVFLSLRFQRNTKLVRSFSIYYKLLLIITKFTLLLLYNYGMIFFYLIIFVNYILSFGLVRLWTIQLLVQVFTLVRGGCDNHKCHNRSRR